MDVSDLPTLSPIGRIGRYELLGRLAVGGMAEVFLARESGPMGASRELVVKRMLPQVARDPKVADMFVQEARLTMRLRHPNICPIYEFGREGGTFFLAMEWVHGVSLRGLLQALAPAGERLPVAVTLSLFADIASALSHAHKATDERGRPLGIIHRDVTPENIMIGFDGIPKLIDFGVAKATTQLQMTEAGMVKGKFAYMAPEQYRGDALDARADVFAFGCCLHEALTGQALYVRNSEFETVAAITLDRDAPSVREARPEISEELAQVVRRALAKDRDERFQDMEELEAALHQLTAKEGERARPADVAALLRDSLGSQVSEIREFDRTPVGSPTGSKAAPGLEAGERFALQADIDEAQDLYASAARRKRRLVWLIAALVVVATLGATAYVLRSPTDKPVPGVSSP